MITTYQDVRLYLRLDDAEWIIHDPRDASDTRVEYEDGRPVEADRFKAARRRAFETFPGADIRGI